MKRVLVAGATGVLGQLVCRELARLLNNQLALIVTDYKTERGKQFADSCGSQTEFRYLNVQDKKSIEQAVTNVDLVIIMLKQDMPSIQLVCLDNNIQSIDVTPFYDFVIETKKLDPHAVAQNTGVILMAGFFPGLSGLMIQEATAHFDEVDKVDIGLLQNTNANVGATGILDMLQIISAPVNDDGQKLPGFAEKRKMYFADYHKEKEVRRIEHAERRLLKDTFPIEYWTGWNAASFNRVLSLLKKSGLLSFLRKLDVSKLIKHNPNKDEKVMMTVEVTGTIAGEKKSRQIALQALSDYLATAMMTAALTKIALNRHVKGVVAPYDVASLTEILRVMDSDEVKWGNVYY